MKEIFRDKSRDKLAQNLKWPSGRKNREFMVSTFFGNYRYTRRIGPMDKYLEKRWE